MQATKNRDWLDWVQLITTIVASIAIPVVLLIVGNGFTSTQNNNANQLKYVEIALGILKTEPVAGDEGLRAYAVSLLEVNSPVKILTEAKEKLLTKQLKITANLYLDVTGDPYTSKWKTPNIDVVK